ncbi:glycosyltransferase family 2 protein [Arachidicoccus sp.]|uniref:glycosyltransferase family 2 protein n=1 Tax=Arachidicoccus sp. TaxID=1872624 RepID=UPI003D193D32
MTSPVISIILPTYNGERYIRTSIESCLNQSFQDFELIIVNDCSTDSTKNIIEEYAANDKRGRIKIINNPYNKKLPLSLNAGFEQAIGKYYTWTSDDNYYAPNALQTLLDTIEADDTIDLVYTDYTLIDNNGIIIGQRTFHDIYDSFHRWKGCGACFLYKAIVHSALNGYNPCAFLIEDYDFFVRAFLQFQFKYIQNYELYYYREHAASLTGTQSDWVNDLSKIFIERQLPSLIKKLPKKEGALLYRKFAVYFSVYKNNKRKSNFYLEKLYKISKIDAWKAVIYIPIIKLAHSFTVGFSGLKTLFLLSLKK